MKGRGGAGREKEMRSGGVTAEASATEAPPPKVYDPLSRQPPPVGYGSGVHPSGEEVTWVNIPVEVGEGPMLTTLPEASHLLLPGSR